MSKSDITVLQSTNRERLLDAAADEAVAKLMAPGDREVFNPFIRSGLKAQNLILAMSNVWNMKL
jgi:hypothetical protein